MKNLAKALMLVALVTISSTSAEAPLPMTQCVYQIVDGKYLFQRSGDNAIYTVTQEEFLNFVANNCTVTVPGAILF
jgi:hypothetical protein